MLLIIWPSFSGDDLDALTASLLLRSKAEDQIAALVAGAGGGGDGGCAGDGGGGGDSGGGGGDGGGGGGDVGGGDGATDRSASGRLRVARSVREGCCHLLLHRASLPNAAAVSPSLLRPGPPTPSTSSATTASSASASAAMESETSVVVRMGSLACVPPLLLFAPHATPLLQSARGDASAASAPQDQPAPHMPPLGSALSAPLSAPNSTPSSTPFLVSSSPAPSAPFSGIPAPLSAPVSATPTDWTDVWDDEFLSESAAPLRAAPGQRAAAAAEVRTDSVSSYIYKYPNTYIYIHIYTYIYIYIYIYTYTFFHIYISHTLTYTHTHTPSHTRTQTLQTAYILKQLAQMYPYIYQDSCVYMHTSGHTTYVYVLVISGKRWVCVPNSRTLRRMLYIFMPYLKVGIRIIDTCHIS